MFSTLELGVELQEVGIDANTPDIERAMKRLFNLLGEKDRRRCAPV